MTSKIQPKKKKTESKLNKNLKVAKTKIVKAYNKIKVAKEQARKEILKREKKAKSQKKESDFSTHSFTSTAKKYKPIKKETGKLK
jgi:hypothetical protein